MCVIKAWVYAVWNTELLPSWSFCDLNGTYKKCHGETKNVYFYRNNFTDESIRNSNFHQNKLKQGWGHLPTLVIWGKKIEGWGNWMSFKPNGQRTTGCSEQTKQEAPAQIKWRWQISLVLGLFLSFIFQQSCCFADRRIGRRVVAGLTTSHHRRGSPCEWLMMMTLCVGPVLGECLTAAFMSTENDILVI